MLKAQTGLAFAAALALVTAAGCGSTGSGSRVASLGGSSSGATPTPSGVSRAQLFTRFAQCLRQHGANEPDPTIDDQGNPHWQVALDSIPPAQGQPCQHIVQLIKNSFQAGGGGPSTRPSLAQQTRFAQCMRRHGVPVQDPNPQTGLQRPPGLDVNAPNVQAAIRACQSNLPAGSLTRPVTAGG
jgi:hypothetical protein